LATNLKFGREFIDLYIFRILRSFESTVKEFVTISAVHVPLCQVMSNSWIRSQPEYHLLWSWQRDLKH